MKYLQGVALQVLPCKARLTRAIVTFLMYFAGVQARHPERQLHGQAPGGPLPGTLPRRQRHLRARVHH